MVSTMDECLTAFKEGKFVAVMDSSDREDECDLIIHGEKITAEQMAFMIRESTGIVCVVSDQQHLESLGLYPATRSNTDKNATAFYVATDYLPGTTTGVSAADRVATIRAMCDPESKADDFSKPGHMFPLCARQGGVLERGGHTESAYDLCRFAGMKKVAAIAEMMHADGTMLRLGDSKKFAAQHGIPLVTVDMLQAHAKAHPELYVSSPQSSVSVIEKSSAKCKLQHIDDQVRLHVFEPIVGEESVVAVVKGDVAGRDGVPVRLHSECLTGDVLGSQRCDCGEQLAKYFKTLNKMDCGICLYIKGHEGRGIGIANKISAYALQEQGYDTVEANLKLGRGVDERSYAVAVEALKQLDVKGVKLFTNNPEKIAAVSAAFPVQVAALDTLPFDENVKYLQTKRDKCSHSTVLGDFKLPAVDIKVDGQIGIVHTTWNDAYIRSLLDGVKQELQASKAEFTCINVPGCLDLVAGARAMLRRQGVKAVICVGVSIRGKTDMHDHVCSSVSQALAHLNAIQEIPIVTGLLMCNDESQARVRCDGPDNHGPHWARSALQMMAVAQG